MPNEVTRSVIQAWMEERKRQEEGKQKLEEQYPNPVLELELEFLSLGLKRRMSDKVT